MTLAKVIDAIIRMPNDFNVLGNVSILALLKESGYFAEHKRISEETIFEKLAANPERVNDWIIYSADKRTSQGWYFMEDDKNRYVVGYFDVEGGIREQNEFDDPITACANFIKKEIEAIRKRH